MKLTRTLFALAAVSAFVLRSAAADVPQKFNGATPLEWSQRLADSEMKRLGTALEAGGSNPKARWDYSPGVLALGLVRLGETTGNSAYTQFGTRAVASHVNPDGTIKGYKEEDYNIDNIPPGKVLLAAIARGDKNPAYVKAVQTLRDQMRRHPRTSEGGFWHKKRYPHQMWLDGLYMASPFLAQYAVEFDEPALFDDVAKQIVLMDAHSYDPATGLFWHAWDEARAQSWADKKTGFSPHFWSRAIGWYAMAIVDSLDYLPVSQPEIDHIVGILKRLADGVVRWQDPKTGVWWQITNLGTRPGNYLEGSGSSMFVYALAKAVNKGYLPREKYEAAILKGYQGLLDTLIKSNPDGTIRLTQICQGAGLGYTMANGRPRDGSFDYYISEPIVDNDPKGTGPFILAGIEVEKMVSTKSAATASFQARGWDDYERVLARIKAPTFPAKDFPITDFGATAGSPDSSDAIAKAIAACHAAGGGRVVIPAGEWFTGAIHLQSNVNLHVSKGATLKFLTDPKKYPIVFTRWEGVELMNVSPFIYAWEQENIAITGEGTLDGQADWDNWWGWNKKEPGKVTRQKAARDRLLQMGETNVPVAQRVFGPDDHLRPNFIQPYRCKNILIEGVSIIRSPMWEINPVLSENITVRGVKIHSHGPNNDGCDPESSRDILIEDCVFDTGDDCIAIKSGRNNDGRRVGVPTENIVIRNSKMLDGHGGVVLGSECSGGIRNVFVENCEMDSPNLDRALRFKNNAVRGGVLENVFMRNVRVGRVGEAVLTIDFRYEEGAKGDFKPVVRNVQLENVTSSASPRALYIRGIPAGVIEGIRVKNCQFNDLTEPEVVEHAGIVTFTNVTLTPKKLPKGLNSVPSPEAK
ncbi:glycoside hydrolase family 88 protein [Oleiharenicola sp. Vm1]|uniref:glycoside hydrolase family 88 protein n=1 Tax=Oleiharenicola sp. Vm1 TaxID=3398393 RepID=UPI0039F55B8F